MAGLLCMLSKWVIAAACTADAEHSLEYVSEGSGIDLRECGGLSPLSAPGSHRYHPDGHAHHLA
jgi:hypothetical protein